MRGLMPPWATALRMCFTGHDETRSRCVLKSAGAYRYAADPRTTVLCAAYTVDDDPVKLWTPGDPVPPEFIEAARNATWTVVAHNDQFEAAIEQFLLAPRSRLAVDPARPAPLHHGDVAGPADCRRELKLDRGCSRAKQSKRSCRREVDASDIEAASAT